MKQDIIRGSILDRGQIRQEWRRMSQRERYALGIMLQTGELTLRDKTMRFSYFKMGDRPPNGYSLVFGLHGGGGCPSQVNQSQYDNHKHLYDQYLPPGIIWFVPRSCEEAPDMWWKEYLVEFFTTIIRAFVLNHIVDSNRVYMTGYSAGGDGIYHLAPMMADVWAGAAMMAGHPNEAKMDNLRNTTFSIQVGGQDEAYNRNQLARQYIQKLERLKEQHGGFNTYNQIFEDKGHWMHKEDSAMMNAVLSEVRNPYPDYILFRQHPRTRKLFFYYIEVNPSQHGDDLIIVKKQGNNFEIQGPYKTTVRIYVNELMVNYDQQVTVTHNGRLTMKRKPLVNMGVVKMTVEERADPEYVFQDCFVSTPK